MSIVNLLSVFFLAIVQLAQGKFITAACRARTNYCVQQNSKGTWCFAPDVAPTTPITSCTAAHVELQGALQSHLNQDLSIAYYNGVDNNRLGGVDYAVPATPGIVRMCLSNSGGDQILQTLCFNVAADNSVDGDPWCVVTVGPPVVSDGCYPEKFNTNATTANTPTYSSTVHPPTNQINLASAIVAPFVMAVFSVILSMSIGM